MITAWLPKNNLKALVDILAGFVGYSFDSWDWDGIELGLTETDEDRGIWYEHPLQGATTLKMALSVPPGSGVVNIRLEGDAEVEAKAEVAVMIAQCYDLAIR